MPSTPDNAGFVTWKYNDWRRQGSLSDQIWHLQRHIEEVERYAFESQDRGRRLTLQQNMIPYLQQQLDRLEAKNKLSGTRLGQTARFKRGTGA